MAVKRQKKAQLRAYIRAHEDVDLPENFLYDVQVKRLHEYKRQLMNALSLVDLYNCLKEDEDFRRGLPARGGDLRREGGGWV